MYPRMYMYLRMYNNMYLLYVSGEKRKQQPQSELSSYFGNNK